MSRRREIQNIGLGIALLIFCHLAFVFLFLPLCNVFLTRLLNSPELGFSQDILNIPTLALLGIGITQTLYVIPLCLYLAKRRRYTLMKGVIIGACLTALLNGACYVLFITGGLI